MMLGGHNREVVIERRTTTQDPVYGTAIETWSTLATVWAEVQDMLPSRAERAGDGIDLSRRPSRVRMLFREDVDTTMRFRIGDRVLKIISGPAELGFRERVEFIAEEISTGGQEP